MNDSIWQIDNKDWMTEREAEWKQVVTNLNLMNNEVDRKGHRYHKELFFNGVLNPDLTSEDPVIQSKTREIRIFGNNELLFRMWYHPQPSLELFEEIVFQARYNHEIRSPRVFIFNTFSQNDFASEYGMFGGREELMVRAFVPSLDSSVERQFFRRNKVSLGLAPNLVYRYCTGATYVMLQSSAEHPTNPFSPGQYLWDHLDYALQNHWDKVIEENKISGLLVALHRIIDFYEREGAHHTREYAIKLQESLHRRFEDGGFGSRLMGLYAEQKSRFEAGEPEPKLN